jgi:hypothetical protein
MQKTYRMLSLPSSSTPDDEKLMAALFEAVNRLVEERTAKENIEDDLLAALPTEVVDGALRKPDAVLKGTLPDGELHELR